MRSKRLPQSSAVRTLITLVISACSGTGSGLTGIATEGGDNGNAAPPVLGFFVQPNSANVGRTITPAVQVVARDSVGNINANFAGRISITLTSNSTGAALAGTTTARARSGIASFGNLAVNRVGSYTLQATATGATPVTSAAFSVTTSTAP